MKNRFSTRLILFIPLTLSSCITSLQHLATYQNIVTNDRIIGSWEQGGKHILIETFGTSPYKELFKEAREGNTPFSAKDSIFALKHYIITYGEKEFNYFWVAAMVKVGKFTFVSLAPGDYSKNTVENSLGGLGLEAHSFAKLEWDSDDSFHLRFLDGDYVKDIVLSGKVRIPYEYDRLFGTFVITASAQELEQFLEKYGNDQRLFRTGNTITLVRKT